MATILTKRSNTASSVPVAGDLTNSSSGAELAVNTADKRLFTKDSGGTVVELGTNPSSLTLPNGTANGLAFLNASKVLTSGSALTFDGNKVNTTKYYIAQGALTAFDASSGGLYTYYSSGGNIGAYADNSGTLAPLLSAGSYHVWSTASEQMRLTSTGLGIGTSSPSWKLTISDGTTTGGMIPNGGNLYLGTISNHPLLFRTNNTDRMTLDSSGNLGIGTSSPGVKLDVQGTGTQTLRVQTNTSGNPTLSLNAAGADGVSLLFDRSGNALRFDISAITGAMYLNTAGNLGLGVTPSAWSGYKPLQAGSGASFGGYAGDVLSFMGSNTYNDNTNWKYILSGNAAARYQQSAGVHAWYTAPSGTAGNAISFTQAMTLDASGNLGVGATSGFNAISGTETTVYIKNSGANLASLYLDAVRKWAILSGSGGQLGFYDVTSGAERARIDSSGNLLIGTTSASTTAAGSYFEPSSIGYGRLNMVKAATGTTYALAFYYAGTQIGNIANSTTATAYNTSSDYRLKEDIQPMTGALAKVAALKPCTYKWKADGSDGEGFIAHELQAVVPQCVTGEKDAVDAEGKPVYQGIDTSFLVATLTAAIQELKAEFDAYKASHP